MAGRNGRHTHGFVGIRNAQIHFAVSGIAGDDDAGFGECAVFGIEVKAGHALFGTFGNPMTTDPSALGKDSGVANTNIVFHAGRLLALEEAHQPFELDAKTLDPRGYIPYAGAANRFTAHPKIDPETGEPLPDGIVGAIPSRI